ncbi:MAG TPA: helix-turn-helix domain-containing protein [Myxococcaceae bacterium]|nr:helix-turn-helix domain-containing protein [Myxococcaceae bacterium]
MVRRKTEPPRGVLRTGVAQDGPYRHERHHPSSDLEPWVEHYWTVQWDLRGSAPQEVQTLPHPSVHLIFEADGKSRIAGPSRARFSRLLEGKGGVFAAKFKPAGFHAFVGTPISRFANRTVPFGEVFGPAGERVERAVLATAPDAERIGLVEDFLRSRRPGRDEHAERVSEMVYRVAGEAEIHRVEHLAARFGLNTRTLQRLFSKYVGVSPKWVIQRYRLHEAAERLAAGNSINQAELALELGYTDQAHFVRDFKSIVGVAPAAYARAARRR